MNAGDIYFLRSRNLLLGVYDGYGGFIGIREKFAYNFLFTEIDADRGGTARPIVKLGELPEGIVARETIDGQRNDALFDYLAGRAKDWLCPRCGGGGKDRDWEDCTWCDGTGVRKNA